MIKRGSESGGATIVANAMPNKGMELTASSVRSAPAFGSSSYLAFGVSAAWARVLQRKDFRRYEQNCRGQVAVPLSGM